MRSAIAALATLVALAFALSTLERWVARRRRHDLAWTVSLLLFALASLFLLIGATHGWTAPVFRAFYFFGAVANVPFLALGTIYLLAGRRQGDAWAIAIALSVAFAGGVLAVAPLTGPVTGDELPQGSDVFGPLPRVLAAVASGAGATVVFGGAVWSAGRLLRGRQSGRLALANLLIALGTAMLSASGLLNSVLGEMDAFAVTLAAGITVIFAGFLVAGVAPARPAPPVPPGSALVGGDAGLRARPSATGGGHPGRAEPGARRGAARSG